MSSAENARCVHALAIILNLTLRAVHLEYLLPLKFHQEFHTRSHGVSSRNFSSLCTMNLYGNVIEFGIEEG